MGRLKIDLPESFLNSYDLRVRITDINYGQHLSNDAVLRMMHDVRCRFYSDYNYSELDIEGYGTIMSGCSIRYLNEAFFNDLLKCQVAVEDINATGFDLQYLFTRVSDDSDIAHGITHIVFYDYEKKKVRRTPESFMEKFIPGLRLE